MPSEDSKTRTKKAAPPGSEGRDPGTRSAGAKPGGAAPKVLLSPPGKEPIAVGVEIARTPQERQRGLMFRQHLDPNGGMLFLFERPDHLSFWMRNTYVPLDMIFIEPGMTVLGVVENATPLSDEPRGVPGKSQYVLEVNAGFSRRHGIGPGTPVRFMGVALPSR